MRFESHGVQARFYGHRDDTVDDLLLTVDANQLKSAIWNKITLASRQLRLEAERCDPSYPFIFKELLKEFVFRKIVRPGRRTVYIFSFPIVVGQMVEILICEGQMDALTCPVNLY